MIIKLLFVAFCWMRRKMSNRITKEWSDLYVCMSYTTLVMSGIFDAFLTPSGNIIVYLIYGKSFHILSTEDQKGFCIPLGLRGKKYLNNIRLLIFDSIHVQGVPFPRRLFLFSSLFCRHLLQMISLFCLWIKIKWVMASILKLQVTW